MHGLQHSSNANRTESSHSSHKPQPWTTKCKPRCTATQQQYLQKPHSKSPCAGPMPGCACCLIPFNPPNPKKLITSSFVQCRCTVEAAHKTQSYTMRQLRYLSGRTADKPTPAHAREQGLGYHLASLPQTGSYVSSQPQLPPNWPTSCLGFGTGWPAAESVFVATGRVSCCCC